MNTPRHFNKTTSQTFPPPHLFLKNFFDKTTPNQSSYKLLKGSSAYVWKQQPTYSTTTWLYSSLFIDGSGGIWMDGGRIVHAWLLVYRLALLWLLVHRLRRLIGNCRLLHHYYVLVGKHVRRLPCIGTDPDFTALLQCKKTEKKTKQWDMVWRMDRQG